MYKKESAPNWPFKPQKKNQTKSIHKSQNNPLNQPIESVATETQPIKIFSKTLRQSKLETAHAPYNEGKNAQFHRVKVANNRSAPAPS